MDFAALSYENYLSAASTTTPQTSITLRAAPEARISSVDQAPFQNLPFYFSFEGFAGAVNRGEDVTPFHMPAFAARSEFAPTVTAPLHFGPWLSVTPSFTVRSTYYGGQLVSGAWVDNGFFRVTEEVSADIRFPVIERVWGGGDTKWKHVIEPYAVYSYVTGVNDFGRFVRFDEDETLTDTNEFEYGVTQRLFRRSGPDGARELVTWRIAQKYFFDPTFGGALVPGQRNVFQTLDSLTPFAFADEPRNLSPIVSDVTVEPGKRYDTQFIVNYDPQRDRLTAIGTLLKLKPYRESFLTLAQFSVENLPVNPMPVPGEFPAALESSAGAGGVWRSDAARLERDLWHELRSHGGGVPESARRVQLQRQVLRHRLRIPEVLIRHDPQRESIWIRIPHRQPGFRGEPPPAGKTFLRSAEDWG